MKALTILFSAPMIRALLDGRKTQTRRIVKLNDAGRIKLGSRQWHPQDETGAPHGCPYGQRGDVLYVKEAWRTESDCYNDLKPSELSGEETILYDADADWSANHTVGRYRHARFMPRWASRLTLLIEDVRVERLQEISEDDAHAEGISHAVHGGVTARAGFQRLWVDMYGPGSWTANPWVWVIQFRTIHQGVDAYMREAA